jgi:hypothetical protein
MRKMLTSRFATLPLLAAIVLTQACGSDEPVRPTPIEEPPQSIEVYSGPLDPNGTNTYLFTLQTRTTVQLMLVGAVIDSPLRSLSPVLRIRIATWDGTSCVTRTEVDIAPRLTAGLHAYLDPGTYCAVVTDPGTLTESVGATLRIVAPALLRTGGQAGTRTFSSAITPGGTASRTFESTVPGRVNVTLNSVSEGAVEMALAIGVPASDNSGCKFSRVVRALPGGSAQLSVETDAGDYCVTLVDVGNLKATSAFTVTIEHP